MAEVGEGLGIADVRAVAEVAFEQRLDDAILHALLAGEADHAMGLHGVGRAGELLEMEVDADARGHAGDALVHLLRALGAAELGEAVLLTVDAFGWHLGIELEGMPGDGEAQLGLFQDVEGALEMALADVAPRTDDIGNDVDASGCGHRVHGKNPFRRRGLAYTCRLFRATRPTR